MIDAVLTHPHSPLTCGVVKFSSQLAQRLGVPCLPFDKHPVAHPLISIKGAELRESDHWPITAMWYRTFDLFLHDEARGLCRDDAVRHARRVYVGNPLIAAQLRSIREDIIPVWCPSTVQGNASRGAYNVLAFGMSHKLALDKFRALKQQLEIEHPDYTVSLSTAVHEGSPWDQALTESTEQMRAIFGDKLRVLGYLGDDALAKELQDCSAVAVYFDPAVRENNTSVWAAVSAGKTVYTNTDEHSPDLDPEKYSWDNLVSLLR